MNLRDYITSLAEMVQRYPHLADRDIIVRNIQGFESDTDNPEEENAGAPYYLGDIAGIEVDRYISTEDATYFKSDYDNESEDILSDIIRYIQASCIWDGDERDPEEMSDEEVRSMWDALPWKEAIVAGIGIAVG